MANSIENRILPYAMTPIFVGLALAVSKILHPYIPHTEDYAFLAAVVASAWLGRLGSGILAAVIAGVTLDYFFLSPLYTFGIDRASVPYLVPFFLSALAAAWMSATYSAAKEATASLRQGEEKFRRILANLPDMSWTADENGKIVYLSPKVEELLGYSSEELRAGDGMLLYERVHPGDREKIRTGLNALFTEKKPFDMEFRFQTKSGEWIWIYDRALRTHDKDGIRFADGLASDITLRKRAEIELQSKTAFLEAQVNATIDAILVLDANARRLLINQRMIDMFEIPSGVLATVDDRPMLNHVLQKVKDPETFLARVNHLNSHPEESSHEEIELNDGRFFDRYSASVVDKNGKYYGRIWSLRDITQRKHNEATLRQLSAAVEQSPSSIIITNLQGNITYVNHRFTECSGYTSQEVVGKNPLLLNGVYAPPEMYGKLWSTVIEGKEWHGEFRSRKKNGEAYWESATIIPVLDQSGAITHFLAVKQDITERRSMESELRQAQKLEAIGQLAAGIAHEINTPTQFVMDNLTFLDESWKAASELIELYQETFKNHLGKLSPETAVALGKAEQRLDLEYISEEVPRAIAQSLDGARRVGNIVRAMKEFSHPDSADKTDTDLNKAIMSTITVARNEWKYVAEVVTNFDENLPLVFCYAGDVNQVILNLLVNAAHAIKEKTNGIGKGTITVSTRLCGDHAEISVADTGMGIPEDIRTRVYEPFFTTKEVGKGTGQGLALAHTVVIKKHHGKIWFETEVGRGTTFFIQLPLRAASTPKEK